VTDGSGGRPIRPVPRPPPCNSPTTNRSTPQGLDILSCILCLFVIGFFGYVSADYVTIVGNNGGTIVIETSFSTPWYVILAIVMGVLDFLLTLTSSILGCVAIGGQATSRGVNSGKLGIDTVSWILMLVAAACCTGAANSSLSAYTNSCSDYGWSISCSFGVGVAVAWALFGLLFITSILHAVALKHGVAHNEAENGNAAAPVVVAAPAEGDAAA